MVQLREHLQVGVEVGQQNVFAEILQGRIRVARQPVVDDLRFCFHGASESSRSILLEFAHYAARLDQTCGYVMSILIV